jgi:hypothetical protein
VKQGLIPLDVYNEIFFLQIRFPGRFTDAIRAGTVSFLGHYSPSPELTNTLKNPFVVRGNIYV